MARDTRSGGVLEQMIVPDPGGFCRQSESRENVTLGALLAPRVRPRDRHGSLAYQFFRWTLVRDHPRIESAAWRRGRV